MNKTQPITAERWITKEEAAKKLKVSTREVQRMAARGQMKSMREQPNKAAGIRYARTLYLEADVGDLVADRAQGIRNPQTPQAGFGQNGLAFIPQAQVRVADAQVDAFRGLAEHLTKLSALFPPPRPQPRDWMTVQEAAEYSGMLLDEIKRLMRMNIIYGTGKGPKTWRIQRASLDEYSSRNLR